ncbi:translation termination inhibitor protein itt1 [Arachnomyces sp. PD_36]|nr:translation termination inhibitor protein itt1 [Arachnomyces sp. PD_36]
MEEDLNDERATELSSITAIYPEIVLDPSSPFRASLEIPISPTVPLKVRFQQFHDIYFPTPPTSLEPSDSGASNGVKDEERVPVVDGADPDVHSISHLPPLTLQVELPDGYPSEEPPKFTLTTDPGWLPASKISELLSDGRRLWEESGKDLIVFAYIDHLQQCAESAFGLCDDQLSGTVLSRDLEIALLDFDIKAKRQKFERETFECGICLEPKKGSNCHRLFLCSHVFCVPCLRDFYNSCINEGNIDNVKCLSPDCGKNTEAPAQEDASPDSKRRKKQDRTLGPSELLQIPLEQEVVQRYVQLKRKRKLELDKTTVYCPREWCQGAARSKKHPKPVDPINEDVDLSSDDEDEPMKFDPSGKEAELPPMSERVVVCEDCSYAFCCVCRKGWHGELERCFPPRPTGELTAEEKATEDYLKTYTSPCPTCSAPCQKSMGCNHMICFKCRSHFCYLCSTWLIEANPYAHFNDPGSGCYMRLWDMEGGDGIDPAGNRPFDFPEDDDFIGAQGEDDGPEWEFADDSDDDEPGNILPRNQVRPPRPPPPPAPAPPRAIPPLNGNPNRGGDGLDAAGRAAAAEREALANAIAQARDRPIPRRPLHNRRGAPQPPHQRNGLQRFLELVQNDQEDEWDSDELDDDF